MRSTIAQRVLGIDPGLNITGYALVERRGRTLRLAEAGVIRPGSARVPLPDRLESLYDALVGVLDQYHPEVLAIEAVFSHRQFPGTAVWMAHARGVLLLAAAQRGVTVCSYAPATVKLSLVGNGRASKAQVQHMVAQRLGIASLPGPSDLSDAVALAITHLEAGDPMTVTSERPAVHPVADGARPPELRRKVGA